MLNIHSIETFGTNDGPGIRLVIFTQGCNFRCLYCQNPDTWSHNTGKPISTEEIIQKLLNQIDYIKPNGGITVSGGEPTLQAKDLIDLFKKCRELGIHTALDTNGAIFTEEVKELYSLTDLVLLDIKHIDNLVHQKLTQHPNINPLKLAEFRENQNKPMWLRYVLVPGFNDQEEYLNRFGDFFKGYTNIERIQILPLHHLGSFKYKELGLKYQLENLPPPDREKVSLAKSILSKYFNKVTIK